MYESCQNLLHHVLDVHSRGQARDLMHTIEHLFDCATHGDCPVRESCLGEVTLAQGVLAEKPA